MSQTETSSVDTPPLSAEKKSEITSTTNGRKTPSFKLNPLAPYKGVLRRYFTVQRHVLGLLSGGLVAYFDSLPKSSKTGFNSLFLRFAVFMLRPIDPTDIKHSPFAVQLRRRLEQLGPTYIKLGQIMAIRQDLLPPEITNELENLLDRLPTIPFEQVNAIIERDLGRPIKELFLDFNEDPIGSASIAQAHRATTKFGEEVVLKVIKPGIKEVITLDLKLLEILGGFLQIIIPKFQPKTVIAEFSSYTIREVDYGFEADNAEIFAANFADYPGIVFPKIYRSLSSNDVLTMEFMDGYKPGSDEMRDLPAKDRARLVDLGALAIIRMLYKDGFFHADLHAGNLMILPGNPVRLGFIDLGMVGRFEDKTRREMLYYFHALVAGDIDGAAKYLTAMAKVGPGGDANGFRRAVADMVRRFVMQSGKTDISIAEMILESTGLGGRFKIFFPVEMTLMVKALVTFEGVGRSLDPNIDVPEVSEKHVKKIFLEQFNPANLGRELMRSGPEMLDLLVRMPQLISTGSKALEDFLGRPAGPSPLAGLRSSIVSGSCIVGGTIAAVQGSPPEIWASLFGVGLLLYLFGK